MVNDVIREIIYLVQMVTDMIRAIVYLVQVVNDKRYQSGINNCLYLKLVPCCDV